MNNNEKINFLEYANKLAYKLEQKTNKIIELYIGTVSYGLIDVNVTIAINNPKYYYGFFEKIGWNEETLFNSLNNFEPVKNNYLTLNNLIEMVYNK